MSRGIAAVVTAGACAVLAAGAPAKPAPDPERALVRAVEFDLTLSRTKLPPGRAIIQFLNDGEDPHDLRMQRTDLAGKPEFGLGEIGPGEYENLDARLGKRATYTLWCSLADHRGRGMEATLRTKKRKRR
jgi:hypothetical protein